MAGYWGNYIDPGQQENKTQGYSQKWGDQPASPAGDWAKRGFATYYQDVLGREPYRGPDPWGPDAWEHAYSQIDPIKTGSFMGMAGPVRAIKEPIAGGLRTVLQYYKDANPAKVLGELTYSKASGGGVPLFENIVSGTPRGTGELLGKLQKSLGPMLNDMEITSIQPQAASFWERLARSSRLDNYPGLRERILQGVGRTEQATPNSYNYNPYKDMGYFE